MTRKLAAAAEHGVLAPDVRQLQNQLDRRGGGQAQPVRPAWSRSRRRRTSDLSHRDRLGEGHFAVAAVQKLVGDAYRAALMAPHKVDVTVPDFDDVRDGRVQGGVRLDRRRQPDRPARRRQRGRQRRRSDAAGPGLPPVTVPPATLVGQLSALPATWSAAGWPLETSVAPAAFSTAMTAGLKSAGSRRRGRDRRGGHGPGLRRCGQARLRTALPEGADHRRQRRSRFGGRSSTTSCGNREANPDQPVRAPSSPRSPRGHPDQRHAAGRHGRRRPHPQMQRSFSTMKTYSWAPTRPPPASSGRDPTKGSRPSPTRTSPSQAPRPDRLERHHRIQTDQLRLMVDTLSTPSSARCRGGQLHCRGQGMSTLVTVH